MSAQQTKHGITLFDTNVIFLSHRVLPTDSYIQEGQGTQERVSSTSLCRAMCVIRFSVELFLDTLNEWWRQTQNAEKRKPRKTAHVLADQRTNQNFEDK